MITSSIKQLDTALSEEFLGNGPYSNCKINLQTLQKSFLEANVSDSWEEQRNHLMKVSISRKDIFNNRPADQEMFWFISRCYGDVLFPIDNESSFLKDANHRQLWAITIFNALFHSTILGCALVNRKIQVNYLAQSLCGRLALHLLRQFAQIIIGDLRNSYRYYLPESEGKYCTNYCCTKPLELYPNKALGNDCVIYKCLNVIQIFSQYDEE